MKVVEQYEVKPYNCILFENKCIEMFMESSDQRIEIYRKKKKIAH